MTRTSNCDLDDTSRIMPSSITGLVDKLELIVRGLGEWFNNGRVGPWISSIKDFKGLLKATPNLALYHLNFGV